MMEKKGKNMGWAFLAITMLIGMAMLGIYIPAEVEGASETRNGSLIDEVISEPYYVENGGEDNVTVTLAVNLLDSEIDHENSTVNFYHMETGEPLLTEFPDPIDMDENLTTNQSRYVFDIGIPLDATVGEYNLTFTVFNLTGANETYDMTSLQINWSERQPMMDNGTVYIHEDDTAVVDLNDHFSDVNMQTLMYYINFSAIENLTVDWSDGSMNEITITPPENWNGEQKFELNVTDGIANLTFMMTIIVEPVDDPLVSADVIIEVDEVEMETDFDPLTLFTDPDGPVDDLVVSLGWEWALNETNVSYMMPIWSWTDGNFSVEINSSDNSGMAMMVADLEEGSVDFHVSAWINGTFVINGTATLEIVPVNDIPVLVKDKIDLIWNTVYSGNLSTFFTDAEGDDLNFTVNSSMANNISVDYDWETFDITITPEINWTGTNEFKVNVTDGMDFAVFMIEVNVMLEKFTISGQITFEEQTGVMINFSNVTFMIGDMEVTLDENGTYSVELDEGTYAVSLSLAPADLLYNEASEQSGYEIMTMDDIVLSDVMTKDITISWKVYESPVEMAAWSDIDFDKVTFEEDDDIIVAVPVKEGSETKEGFEDLTVTFVITVSDDEELTFNMTYDATDMQYELTLTDDDLEDLGEGKKEYFFTNADGTEETSVEKYEFKKKDDGAGTMTIIILVALIVLVLIALIFIMKKPSDEDFDEDEEDEEEEDGRSCSGCGEVVTDDEAEECPYCGEDLEE